MDALFSTRDKVGRDDMVMLQEVSENGILENLKKRYVKGLIYTGIGQVLVSVNHNIDQYHGKQPFELPPHVFALTDAAYRALIADGESQVIIVSGESGAGKTEVAKGVMKYISAVTGSGVSVDKTKEVILNSNPLLESFGNAKTLRNNNSSRFGKFVTINFDHQNLPCGGLVTNYLLEKSRLVYQIKGERSFHIFYQLFASNDKGKWNLKAPSDYRFLNGGTTKADGINDKADYQETKQAMGFCGIGPQEQDEVLSIVAGILHLGNVEFAPQGGGSAVKNKDEVKNAAQFFGMQPQALDQALCKRTINDAATGKKINVDNSPADAEYARDALAKGIYSRIFDWIVFRINKILQSDIKGHTIGILDIYGFEIFEVNQFEQLMINLTNEQLHQIFVDLTLKREQAEYSAEGIPWEPVEYTDNRPCVELILKRPVGVLALLDEECVVPKGSEEKFLDKCNQRVSQNPHWIRMDGVKQKQKNVFGIKHYAGPVTYVTDGMMDKNKDTLFDNLINVCGSSKFGVIKEAFSTDLQRLAAAAKGGKKRPETAGQAFAKSLKALLDVIYQCSPHYVRCIKPNESKSPLKCDDERVREQIAYLGLLESLRVRRAGYCYRNTYEKWIKRYYMLTPKTFPNWTKNFGSDREAVEFLLKYIGLQPNEYAMGKTKVFIREPNSLYRVEQSRFEGLIRLATMMQSTWKMYKMRKAFLAMKDASKNLFHNKKERRRRSLEWSAVAYYGDFNLFRDSNDMRTLHQQYGDSTSLFSYDVRKISRKFKPLPRTIVLTDKAIYHMVRLKAPKNGMSYDVRRRTDIKDIDSISLTSLADDFIVIHISKVFDYVLEFDKKNVLATILVDAYAKRAGRDLRVNFGNDIQYKSPKGPRNISASKSNANDTDPQWSKVGNGITVSVGGGQMQ